MARVHILNYDSFTDRRTGVEFKPAEIKLADGRKVIRGVATVSDEVVAEHYAKHPAFFVEGVDDAPSKEKQPKQPANQNGGSDGDTQKPASKSKGKAKAKAEKPDTPPADPTATPDSAPSPQSPTGASAPGASVVDSPPATEQNGEGESESGEKSE